MGLDAALVGTPREGGTLLITRSRLRLFAKATGQEDPLFTDIHAAQKAGHPDLPVPPTFFFGVDLEVVNPGKFLERIGVDFRSLLHGEQEFAYHRTAHAGDVLHSSGVVCDVYEKKGGALGFLVTNKSVVDADNRLVATMKETLVVRRTTAEAV